MKKNILVLVIVIFFSAVFVCAGETRLEFGRDGNFGGMALLNGLMPSRGADGTADLVLRDRQVSREYDPDIYLGFDEEPIGGETVNFGVRNENNAVFVSKAHKIRGNGSGAFRYGARLLLDMKGGTLFSPGVKSEDFAIGFWMYPATLGEGELIFRWENTSGDDSGRGQPVYHELSCVVSGRVLVWTFTNFFQDSGGRRILRLAGERPLVPRSWRHHSLRFDAATGRLEYRVDGEPEAILYATPSGREDGRVSYPHIKEEPASPLVIGEGFTGFLDEFYVSRKAPEDEDLEAFAAAGGTAETSVIDLGRGGSALLRIEAAWRAAGDSAVFFSYKLEEDPAALAASEWTPFVPGEALSSRRTGRYLLVRAELFPDGKQETSPRLMDFTVVYEQNFPPPPPSFVAATPGDGKVDLYWSPVADPDTEGYCVYYGSRPGVYDGAESSLGPSPVRTGKETRLSLEGLPNGKLYYFSITTYDRYSDMSGQFSNEISARPSRLYHRE